MARDGTPSTNVAGVHARGLEGGTQVPHVLPAA